MAAVCSSPPSPFRFLFLPLLSSCATMSSTMTTTYTVSPPPKCDEPASPTFSSLSLSLPDPASWLASFGTRLFFDSIASLLTQRLQLAAQCFRCSRRPSKLDTLPLRTHKAYITLGSTKTAATKYVSRSSTVTFGLALCCKCSSSNASFPALTLNIRSGDLGCKCPFWPSVARKLIGLQSAKVSWSVKSKLTTSRTLCMCVHATFPSRSSAKIDSLVVAR